MSDISTLVDALENAADWRRQVAVDYPNDKRNGEAAVLLTGLAEGLIKLGNHSLVLRYEKIWESDENTYGCSEIQQETIREVGFQSAPTSAEKFLSDLLDEFESELKEWSTFTMPGGGVMHTKPIKPRKSVNINLNPVK